MPLSGSGVYSLPAGYAATANQQATASQHNTPLEDIVTALNAVPRNAYPTTVSAAWTVTGDWRFSDDTTLSWGDNDELTISANSSTATITETSSGNLRIRAQDLGLYNADGSEAYVFCSENAGVSLYHDNTITARTVSGGLRVDSSLIMTEAADHSWTPVAGYGQFWVKDDAPCVPKFTDDAGTDSDVVLGTPGASDTFAMWDAAQKLVQASITQSKVSSGYVTLPGGVILQWFVTSSIASGSASAQALPITFPNAILHAQATYINGSSTLSAGDNAVAQIREQNAGSVTIANLYAGNAQFNVFAIGH